jgi:hypothetical protein
LFPIVLRPWWMAILSLGLFILILRLVFGPFRAKSNSN